MVETRATKALRFMSVLLSITFSFVVFFDMQNYFFISHSGGSGILRVAMVAESLVLFQSIIVFSNLLTSFNVSTYSTLLFVLSSLKSKQGFERTIVLSRLEQRLIKIQRKYWCVSSAICIQKIRGNEQLNYDQKYFSWGLKLPGNWLCCKATFKCFSRQRIFSILQREM